MRWPSQLKGPRAAFMRVVLSDEVYTPVRAHYRWGKSPYCPHCPGVMGTWDHYVMHCPAMPARPQALPDMPACLRYAGQVPKGYNPAPQSVQMRQAQPPWRPAPVTTSKVVTIATDGGSEGDGAMARAGWGYHSEHPAIGGAHGAVSGPWQTAQRAEVEAVYHVLRTVPAQLVLIVDNQYVRDRILDLQGGGSPRGAHQDLWHPMTQALHKVKEVFWIKSHLEWPEAEARGFSHEHWRLNKEADARATRGVRAHIEDPGAVVLHRYRAFHIQRWQQHLLRCYQAYREMPSQAGPSPAGLQERAPMAGPAHLPQKQRTDAKLRAQHDLRQHPRGEACICCGLSSFGDRAARLQQWRKPCRLLPRHRDRQQKGHKLCWEGEWRCEVCRTPSHRLHLDACPGPIAIHFGTGGGPAPPARPRRPRAASGQARRVGDKSGAPRSPRPRCRRPGARAARRDCQAPGGVGPVEEAPSQDAAPRAGEERCSGCRRQGSTQAVPRTATA